MMSIVLGVIQTVMSTNDLDEAISAFLGMKRSRRSGGLGVLVVEKLW